jgi:hypothetical protein
MSVLELFCDVDDFMLSFVSRLKATQIAASKQRQRLGQLWPSEIMTILIHFHQSHYRTFKAYYTQHVQVYLTSEFPHLVSYTRFVALIPTMLVPRLSYAARVAMEPVRGSASLTQPRFPSAIPNASPSIASLPPRLRGGSRRWAGSLGSSCTWRSTIKASCWHAA